MNSTMKTQLSLAAIVAAFLIISCLCGSAQSAVFSQPAAFLPAHPNKCFDKITRRLMLPGKEYKTKGICAVMSCDLAASMINIETCPQIEMPECEELPADPNWAFPKCCPQFKCTDFKTGREIIISA